MEKPSQLLTAAIRGTIPLSEAPQEALSFVVYRAAVEVMAGCDREGRARLLDSVPEPIREVVREEVMRLWNNRRVA